MERDNTRKIKIRELKMETRRTNEALLLGKKVGRDGTITLKKVKKMKEKTVELKTGSKTRIS